MIREYEKKKSERLNIDYEATGEKLKILLKSKGLKASEIVQVLGINAEQSVYKWYRGDAAPTLEHMLTIANLLGVPIEEIVVTVREEVYVFS